MNVRLKFKKEGPIRFIGHLDLMRTFQKLFMRSGIPVAYSEGFNPHQIFSFAAALAVGVSSEGEYLDLRLKEEVPLEVLIPIINGHAPTGIVITDGVITSDKEPKAMAALAAAEYIVTTEESLITQEMIDELMANKEILVEKKSKKGKINTVDLRPGLYNISVSDNEVHMTIATGSQFNIKPEQVMDFIMKQNGINYQKGYFRYHRVELYQEDNGLKPLLELVKG